MNCIAVIDPRKKTVGTASAWTASQRTVKMGYVEDFFAAILVKFIDNWFFTSHFFHLFTLPSLCLQFHQFTFFTFSFCRQFHQFTLQVKWWNWWTWWQSDGKVMELMNMMAKWKKWWQSDDPLLLQKEGYDYVVKLVRRLTIYIRPKRFTIFASHLTQ